jgi:UDP-GlcNAc3NAcA epimerase
MKIVTIIGARPQFVKTAMVSRALRKCRRCQEVLVHTGQHYDANLSDRFFKELGIPLPDYNLGIGSGSHGVQTGAMLPKIEAVLQEHRPDWALVYGDTNSTLAGALAAAKLRIPVAHVEAGLRSFNRAMPEETNRVLTDHLSEMLFAPTATAVANLTAEGLGGRKVEMVGDVMCDAARFYAAKAGRKGRLLQRLKLRAHKYVLATIHRAENTDDPRRLKVLFEGLALVAEHLPVVLPLHPRTRRAMLKARVAAPASVQITDPVGYFEMLELERHAAVIATDSGGVQKEAFFQQVPCVTLRNETEWTELVAAGWNRLCPPESAGRMAAEILGAIGKRGSRTALYGDGQAAGRIVDALARH